MPDDPWAALADPFEEASATVKGRVRTYVLHSQLLRHLPAPPARVLDVGGGAAAQSLPLARLGYEVTLADPSEAMLARAERRIRAEPVEVQRRMRLLRAEGEHVPEAVGGASFDAVLCHGVLMYLAEPEALLDALCRCVASGGLLSVMALNARTLAVRPALEQRWADALEAFDATGEIGVLGTPTRGDTIEGLSESLQRRGLTVTAWYGVWLFADWLDLPLDTADVEGVAEVELQASLRDPYRQLSRVFHLVGYRR